MSNSTPDFSSDPCFRRAYSITTLVEICPSCESQNFVDLGDLDDQTVPDVEVVRCWRCKKSAWVSSDARELADDMGHESIEDGFAVDGDREPFA